MSTINNRILSLYKARVTILELLDKLGYDVEEYNGFSINEIDAMLTNEQLDMLINHSKNGKKTYIKFYLTAKQIRQTNLEMILEDLYSIENILTKDDTLIVITEDEPNDTITNYVKTKFDQDGVFIVIHNIKRLQFNILNHKLVPAFDILDNKEVEELKTKYNIRELKQLPEISRFDPQALAICLRPGQVCCFHRDSATAMNYEYYRICI